MLHIPDDRIGGAHVRLSFMMGDRRVKVGDPDLTADEVRKISPANRRALSEASYIEIYPKNPTEIVFAPGDKFVVQVGKNEFDVIEGKKLNGKPLSRDEADKLAAN
jgi:hypothetical protein